MLIQRLRRWINIEPAMAQCLVFSRKTMSAADELTGVNWIANSAEGV